MDGELPEVVLITTASVDGRITLGLHQRLLEPAVTERWASIQVANAFQDRPADIGSNVFLGGSGSFGVLALAIGAGLALAGCSGGYSQMTPDKVDPTTQVQSLWADRTAYVGNASKVTSLLSDAGFAKGGAYTVSLHTRTPPYAVTVSYGDSSDAATDVDVERSVTMLLGMVQNLDEVRVVSDGATRSWSAEAVSRRLGYDVKELGHDQSRLTAFVASTAS